MSRFPHVSLLILSTAALNVEGKGVADYISLRNFQAHDSLDQKQNVEIICNRIGECLDK
jgi:hypothetical protein